MYNNKRTRSASEINKYVYCHYQWYYERYYGQKHMRELSKKGNNKNNSNGFKGNFEKGRNFHNSYYKKDKKRKIIIYTFFAIVCLLGFISGVLFFKYIDFNL